MRLPRNLSGDDLIAALARLDYKATRQRGSHVRLTRLENGEHNITVPRHNQLRVGTLSAILRDVGNHLGLTREELVERFFD
jgi:predicted RNA binding protein YcfA (HicA-like mRNA interferase family)